MTTQTTTQKIKNLISDINQLVSEIQQHPPQAENLLTFENIDLPFQLLNTVIKIWQYLYSSENINQLAREDNDALDSWAISLSQSLNHQLQLLNIWLPILNTLPIPEKLQQRLTETMSQITEITKQKSQLLNSTATLLIQEQQLKQDAMELKELKIKAQELQYLHQELKTSNLESLRQEIANQTIALAPYKQNLDLLKQQKSELDEQILALQQQQIRLQSEINYLQSQQKRIESDTNNTATELITLTKSQQQKLSLALPSILTEAENYRLQLIQTQQQLQKAVENCNEYQITMSEMENDLKIHYQVNQELATILPVNHQKMDNLIKTIQQNLSQLDQELKKVQIENENLHQKTMITF